MIENLLWVVCGLLTALVGVIIVYLKNSQKIMHVTPNRQNHHAEINSRSK